MEEHHLHLSLSLSLSLCVCVCVRGRSDASTFAFWVCTVLTRLLARFFPPLLFARTHLQLVEEDELVWDDGNKYAEPCLDRFEMISKVRALHSLRK